VIPVMPQPEPDDFDQKVRQPGIKWLEDHGIDSTISLPPKTYIEDYWEKCKLDLRESYEGICAYLGLYIHLVEVPTVDHFLPKSLRPDLAYEWSNYRFSAFRMNSRKGDYTDIVDPFTISQYYFGIVLLTGDIYPLHEENSVEWVKAKNTIKRLKLDDDLCTKNRKKYYLDFRAWKESGGSKGISEDYLRRHAPFVWQEAQRKGLL
jgi:uncharacterized protein (TIGR02646 family)